MAAFFSSVRFGRMRCGVASLIMLRRMRREREGCTWASFVGNRECYNYLKTGNALCMEEDW
jgi:hypothetical protein